MLLRKLAQRLRELDMSDAAAERLLKGPLSDAMTHAGQLALLRRLSGSPIPPEDFVMAAIDPERIGLEQCTTRVIGRALPQHFTFEIFGEPILGHPTTTRQPMNESVGAA